MRAFVSLWEIYTYKAKKGILGCGKKKTLQDLVMLTVHAAVYNRNYTKYMNVLIIHFKLYAIYMNNHK